jgi:hypothetical protein
MWKALLVKSDFLDFTFARAEFKLGHCCTAANKTAMARPAQNAMARPWLLLFLLVCTLCLAATAQYTSPPASILAGKTGVLNLGLIGPFTFPSANALFYGAMFCINGSWQFQSFTLGLEPCYPCRAFSLRVSFHQSFLSVSLYFRLSIFPSFFCPSNAIHLMIFSLVSGAPICRPLISGHPGGAGFLQAIDDLNARSDLLPNHRIVGWINSTVGMDSAVAATLDLVNRRNIHALIGDFLRHGVCSGNANGEDGGKA